MTLLYKYCIYFLNDHNTQHYIFPNLGYGLVLEFSYVTILHCTTYIHTYILTHQDLFLAYMVDPQSLSLSATYRWAEPWQVIGGEPLHESCQSVHRWVGTRSLSFTQNLMVGPVR